MFKITLNPLITIERTYNFLRPIAMMINLGLILENIVAVTKDEGKSKIRCHHTGSKCSTSDFANLTHWSNIRLIFGLWCPRIQATTGSADTCLADRFSGQIVEKKTTLK